LGLHNQQLTMSRGVGHCYVPCAFRTYCQGKLAWTETVSKKSMSLYASCNLIVLFLKVNARLVAVVLLLHPFSFSFFTAFTALSFPLVLHNYLLQTCFLYYFGVHILSSLSSLSTFVLLLFSHSIQSLKLFICYSTFFYFLPLFIYSAFIFLLSYPKFSYSSTYCHSSSIYSVPCPVAVHICTDKTTTVLFAMERDVSAPFQITEIT
jgi:hypothetical protein